MVADLICHEQFYSGGLQTLISSDELFLYNDDVYRTVACRVSWFARTFPTYNFYRKFAWNVYRSSVKARRGTVR